MAGELRLDVPLPHKGCLCENVAKTAQGDGVFALGSGRKEEDVVLDVGGQKQNVHDLGDVAAAFDRLRRARATSARSRTWPVSNSS